MQKKSFSRFSKVIASTFLRPQIGIHLIDISAFQDRFTVNCSCQNSGKFGVDDDASLVSPIFKDNIGLHARQYFSNAGRRIAVMPVQPFPRTHLPPFFDSEFCSIEISDRLFE